MIATWYSIVSFMLIVYIVLDGRSFGEISPLQSSNRCAYLHESHRTLRDGSLGWRCPRHFVPGYGRTVPPGHFATGSRLARTGSFRRHHFVRTADSKSARTADSRTENAISNARGLATRANFFTPSHNRLRKTESSISARDLPRWSPFFPADFCRRTLKRSASSPPL